MSNLLYIFISVLDPYNFPGSGFNCNEPNETVWNGKCYNICLLFDSWQTVRIWTWIIKKSRIRIRINMKILIWIWIRIKVKRQIRILIKMDLIRNADISLCSEN
jgi:hypothetical protein